MIKLHVISALKNIISTNTITCKSKIDKVLRPQALEILQILTYCVFKQSTFQISLKFDLVMFMINKQKL